MDSLAQVRKRRLQLGISLGELARAVGRSDATLSRIERGQIRPSYDLVQRILAYLEQRETISAPHLTAADVMKREVVTIGAEAPLAQAALQMERGAFSQLPVVGGSRVTGSLSETALLRALGEPGGRRARVRDVQEPAYPQVDGAFPAVLRHGDLVGIVTKTDLIRGLHGTPLRRTLEPENG
ncbi:MAG: CBS domain-containing protein [Thermoplasmata archaeon]|nr:CBS domain-containing protein [Thermoplasmata archaeon]